jgi:hypothetical protein
VPHGKPPDEGRPLPVYAGTEARPASRLDCGADSGDLFQPGLIRTWSLLPGTETEPIVAAIAEELTAAGWTVPTTSNRCGYREPVTFDAAEGWGAGGSLFHDGEARAGMFRARRQPGALTIRSDRGREPRLAASDHLGRTGSSLVLPTVIDAGVNKAHAVAPSSGDR